MDGAADRRSAKDMLDDLNLNDDDVKPGEAADGGLGLGDDDDLLALMDAAAESK